LKRLTASIVQIADDDDDSGRKAQTIELLVGYDVGRGLSHVGRDNQLTANI
jgi:hypothetical protein